MPWSGIRPWARPLPDSLHLARSEGCRALISFDRSLARCAAASAQHCVRSLELAEIVGGAKNPSAARRSPKAKGEKKAVMPNSSGGIPAPGTQARSRSPTPQDHGATSQPAGPSRNIGWPLVSCRRRRGRWRPTSLLADQKGAR